MADGNGRIEKIRTEEIRTRAGVTHIREKIRDARLISLGLRERDEDVEIRRWNLK